MKQEFPPTRWTLIQRAQDEDGTDWHAALGQLCQIYWYPIYAHVRFRGYGAHEAEDHTQGFFASLLERADISRLSSDKGKFRSFLLKSVTNYLANDYRKSQAQKRGGGRTIVSLDHELAERRWQSEPRSIDDPEKLYELTWARTLLQNSLDQLEREYESRLQGDLFQALKDRLLQERSPKETQQLAERFDLTESAVRLAAFRMRKRLATILKEEICHTLSDPNELDAEIDYFMALFAQASNPPPSP